MLTQPTLETCSVFSDILKAFDAVSHQLLIFKHKSIGVSDSVFRLTESFFNNRFQRLLLNDQISERLPVKASVPQDSIISPLFS